MWLPHSEQRVRDSRNVVPHARQNATPACSAVIERSGVSESAMRPIVAGTDRTRLSMSLLCPVQQRVRLRDRIDERVDLFDIDVDQVFVRVVAQHTQFSELR